MPKSISVLTLNAIIPRLFPAGQIFLESNLYFWHKNQHLLKGQIIESECDDFGQRKHTCHTLTGMVHVFHTTHNNRLEIIYGEQI